MTSRARARRRPRTALVAVGMSAVAVAGLAVLGSAVGPQIVANLTTTVAEGETVAILRSDTGSATLALPAGWLSYRGWGDDGQLTLRSPDGALTISARISAGPPVDAFAAAAAARPPELGATATERLRSGLEIVHADTGDGAALLAAVGDAAGSASVQLLARASPDRLPRYRTAIAELVETVRVGP